MLQASAEYTLLDTLYRSPRTIVYRAQRRADRLPVVIKTVNGERPQLRDLAQLRREFYLARRLQLPGVIQVLGLEAWGNNLALIEEDFGGSSLADQLANDQGIPLILFFRIAINLAQILERLHAEIIHGDISPLNILWNQQTSELRLIDFSAASEISRERQTLLGDNVSNTSLPYISPERSGRMNRDLDHRTDLYSFGVTAYQLLSGRLPFVANDRAGWVYAHVTSQPRPLHELKPEIPEALAMIVMRLLAKNPEERYQSALGLRKDLETCSSRWLERGNGGAFVLGQQDISNQIRSPTRLCGRDAEISVLLSAFQAVRSGEHRAVMVSGEEGIGKSMLVNELRRPIFRLNGYFASGKFDQFGHHAPYAAISNAVGQLVVQILSEPEAQVAQWAIELREALAPNAGLMVDLVPELQRVIGQVAPLAPANPVEEQNRFRSTLRAFVRTFARREHPLVLFLDDLQWSDAPTLALIKSLLTDPDIGALLVIGSFREGDVDEQHPLRELLSELAHVCSIEHLELRPLSDAATVELVADMLGTTVEQAATLAESLRAPAHGNPLLLSETLTTLHRGRELFFDLTHNRWCWDTERIAQVLPRANVGDFVRQRIATLSHETQIWLQRAACLGPSFDLYTLAVIGQCTQIEAASGLWEAVRDGLVLPMSDDYRLMHGPESSDILEGRLAIEVQYQFPHDRVQQAAYALIDGAERSATHLRIGQLLLERLAQANVDTDPIQIAQQLNEGVALLSNDEQRLELLRVNLLAARKARATAAYRPAFNLLHIATTVLNEELWQRDFACVFEVLYLYAACAYLTGEFSIADRTCKTLLEHAPTAFEQSQIHVMQLVQLTYCNRMDEAIEAGLSALRLLGLKLSARPSGATILRDLLRVKHALGKRSIDQLASAESMGDTSMRHCMSALIEFIPPAYLTGNDRLFAAVVLQQTLLSLKHGNCPESASAFASYAVLLAGLGQLQAAFDFGQLALVLTDRYGAPEMRCRNLVLYALFAHSWARPWRELRPWFERAVQAGHESGDLLFTTYACGWVCLWDPDLDIATAWEEGRKYLAVIESTPYVNARDAASLHLQFWAALLGRTSSERSLSSASFDEDECQARMQSVRNISGLGILALCKLKLCVICEDYDTGFEILRSTEVQVRALSGSPYMVEYCLFAFLVCASVDGRHARAARRRLRSLRRTMTRWARFCPSNFEQHKLLMDAELARLAGRDSSASVLYDRAIAAARTGRFAHYEALANERALRFYAGRGLDRVAAVYLSEARYHYARWGALVKVQLLDQRDAHLLALVPSDRAAPPLPEDGVTLAGLDSGTVWKAVEMLAEEVIVERLLEKLLSIVGENAGATRSCLMLRDPGGSELFVQSETGATNGRLIEQPFPVEQADLPLGVIRYVARSNRPVLLEDVSRAGMFTSDPYLRRGHVRSVLALPIVHRGRSLGILYLENELATHVFTHERLATLTLLSSQAAISLQNARLYEHVQRMVDSFSRFVPREFLRSLGRSQFLDIRLGESVQKDMTVMFSDIRGFTALVERMSPTENIDFLNSYLSYMEPAIIEAGGFVDSYIGDGIMALFDGSPERAVLAALSMLRALSNYNIDHAARFSKPLRIGIGLNSGLLTLGTIGGADRLKCGVIGDTVNVAARVEGLTKLYELPLLITASTKGALSHEMLQSVRFIDRVRVAGHLEPVEVFEIYAADAPERRERKRMHLAAWHDAIAMYNARSFTDASVAFAELSSSLGDDVPSRMFAARARKYASEPPDAAWSATETLLTK